MQRVGMSITVEGQPIMIFAHLQIVVGDEKALKEIVGFKGASGFRPCPCCQLVCSHRTKDANVGNNVRSTVLDIIKFVPHTNKSILRATQEIYDLSVEVAAGRAQFNVLEAMEKIYGYNDTPLGLLSDRDLCPAPRDAIYFDWYHVFVISGIYQKELQYFGMYLTTSGVQFADKATRFLADWTWPRGVASPKGIFSGFDVNSDHIKCDGHSCTGSYEALAVFVKVVIQPLGVNPLQCASFLKLCDAMDLIMAAKYGIIKPELLLESILTFLKGIKRPMVAWRGCRSTTTPSTWRCNCIYWNFCSDVTYTKSVTNL